MSANSWTPRPGDWVRLKNAPDRVEWTWCVTRVDPDVVFMVTLLGDPDCKCAREEHLRPATNQEIMWLQEARQLAELDDEARAGVRLFPENRIVVCGGGGGGGGGGSAGAYQAQQQMIYQQAQAGAGADSGPRHVAPCPPDGAEVSSAAGADSSALAETIEVGDEVLSVLTGDRHVVRDDSYFDLHPEGEGFSLSYARSIARRLRLTKKGAGAASVCLPDSGGDSASPPSPAPDFVQWLYADRLRATREWCRWRPTTVLSLPPYCACCRGLGAARGSTCPECSGTGLHGSRP